MARSSNKAIETSHGLSPDSVGTKSQLLNSPSRKILPALARGLGLTSLLAVALASSGFRLGDGFEVDIAALTGSAQEDVALGAFTLVVPTIRFGLEIERYGDLTVTTMPVKARIINELREAGLERGLAWRLSKLADQKLGKTKLEGLQKTVITDSLGQVAFVMIELNELEYLRIDVLAEAVTIEDADGIHSEFETMTMFYTGNVDSMLASATSFSGELANKVRSALVKDMPLDVAFETGLVHLIYTAKRDDYGVVRGYGEVEAIRYKIEGEDRTTFRFADDQLDVDGFFLADGSPAMRTWLESPVEGSYMSSAYDLRRLHPVLQTVKPHFGTDFAATEGSPILALSDGVVIARTNAGNNGNFVKLYHDGTYSTQYLHMKAFAKGLRPGKRVKKGEVIGYVGSTGLSTGPHVCLRFWKNNQQVDFQRELKRLPTAPSLDEEAMMAFEKKQAELEMLLRKRA